FSPSTGIPACSAFTVTGWWATGTVGLISRSAPTSRARSTPSVPVATADGSGTPAWSLTRCGAPSTRSATPTSSATGLAAISRAHQLPMAPAPTTTTRAGRSAASGGKPVSSGAGAGAAAVSVPCAAERAVGVERSDDTRGSVRGGGEETGARRGGDGHRRGRTRHGAGPEHGAGRVVGAYPVARRVGALHRRGLPLLGACPDHGVGQHPLDLGLVVDGVLLVARAEVEDLALAATEHGTEAEHLSPGEGGDEHELVGGGDVEHLAVHLLLRDDDRVRDAAGDRMGAVDGPHPLLLAVVAPQQVA